MKAITSAEVVKDEGNKVSSRKNRSFPIFRETDLSSVGCHVSRRQVTRLVSINHGEKLEENIESHGNAVVSFKERRFPSFAESER